MTSDNNKPHFRDLFPYFKYKPHWIEWTLFTAPIAICSIFPAYVRQNVSDPKDSDLFLAYWGICYGCLLIMLPYWGVFLLARQICMKRR